MIGDAQSWAGGTLGALVANLLAVLFVSRPVGALLRRRRPDLPVAVARNYAGTGALALVTLAVLAAGVTHRSSIAAQRRMLDDAVMRAIAYIGARAPDAFRRNVGHPDTYTIQAGVVYRTCVPNQARTRTYCVIVRSRMPLAQSVVFAGYEPNSTFSAGTN